jgi:hypothetical protein
MPTMNQAGVYAGLMHYLKVRDREAEGLGVEHVEQQCGELLAALRDAELVGLLAALLFYVLDAKALGLSVAQGLVLTEAFYWDLNDGVSPPALASPMTLAPEPWAWSRKDEKSLAGNGTLGQARRRHVVLPDGGLRLRAIAPDRDRRGRDPQRRSCRRRRWRAR